MKMPVQIQNRLGIAAVAMALVLPGAFAGDKDSKTTEESVKLTDCPAAVQQTIKDNAAGGEILEVEKETAKDGAVVYEAEVKKADGKKVDIKVAADGKLIKVEADDEDEDDANDAEDEDEEEDDA